MSSALFQKIMTSALLKSIAIRQPDSCLRFGADAVRHPAWQRERYSNCGCSYEALRRIQRQRHSQIDAVRRAASSETKGSALHGDFIMITKDPMHLKVYIKKKATEKHISAQLVMQNYMLERLLERIHFHLINITLSLKVVFWCLLLLVWTHGHYGFGHDHQGFYADP